MEKHKEFQPTRALSTEIKPFPTSYPGGITPDTLFDERTEKIIAAQADKMITTGLFEQHERDDIANELRIILAYEMEKYTPNRDRYTFTATVLAKRGVNEMVRRSRELRDNPRPISLDAPVSEGGNATLLDVIPADDDCFGRNAGTSEKRQRKIARGISAMLDGLSPLDREICKSLMAGDGIREIGRNLGIPHSAVIYRLRTAIAAKASECGLDNLEGGDEA